MKLSQRFLQLTVSGLLSMSAAAPALADREVRNTVIGAGVGALAGAVLSQGDPLVTAGSALAGGVLGNVLTDDDRDKRRHSYRKPKNRGHHYKASHRHHRHR